MDFTSRMVGLLARMRRERNGAVADAMRLCGASYGLNYGVSLPTLRRIARAEPPDHDFARYLYVQDVRELRLAALHIARPECLTAAQAEQWATGIVNSEVAEEAAFALLSRAGALGALFEAWARAENPLLAYTALLAAARSPFADPAWAATAIGAVRRHAADVSPHAAQLVAQGAVALLAALGAQNEENRLAVLREVGSLGKLPAADFIHEELSWRLEA